MVLSCSLPWTLPLLLLASYVSMQHLPYHWLAVWYSELWLFPAVPFLFPYHLRVLEYVLRSCLLRFLLTLGLHFLSLMALKFSGILFRCPAPVLYVVFFSLLHWGYPGLREKITEEKCHFQHLKGCAASTCHVVLSLNTCWGSPFWVCPNTCFVQASRRSGGKEERKGRHNRII